MVEIATPTSTAYTIGSMSVSTRVVSMITRAAQFVRHTSRMAAGLSDPTAATMSRAATVAIGTFSMALPKSSRTTATITPA